MTTKSTKVEILPRPDGKLAPGDKKYLHNTLLWRLNIQFSGLKSVLKQRYISTFISFVKVKVINLKPTHILTFMTTERWNSDELNTFTTYLSWLLGVIAIVFSNHAQKWWQICCKSVQLDKVAFCRSDFFQDWYFRDIMAFLFLDKRNVIIGSVVLAVIFSLGIIIGYYGRQIPDSSEQRWFNLRSYFHFFPHFQMKCANHSRTQDVCS